MIFPQALGKLLHRTILLRYIEKDRKIARIHIDESCYKVIEYSVLWEIKFICLKWYYISIFKCSSCNAEKTWVKLSYIKNIPMSCVMRLNQNQNESKKLNIVAWPVVGEYCFVVFTASWSPFVMLSFNLMMVQTKGTTYSVIIQN